MKKDTTQPVTSHKRRHTQITMSQQQNTGDALHNSPLGKSRQYADQYDPSLLYGVPRSLAREAIGLQAGLPFCGADIWNLYELSWLDKTARPVMAMAELRVPVDSPCIIESKSMKLYCNSLNMSRFEDASQVQSLMKGDLSRCAGAPVEVFIDPNPGTTVHLGDPEGICIDLAQLKNHPDSPDPSVLRCLEGKLSERLFSRLFRSRCPVTGQPDWATIIVDYTGEAIDHGAMLEYIISYRTHQSFHEACVEQMFIDIIRQCNPEKLQLTARFTRRGGIDINPVRSTHDDVWTNFRTRFQ